MLVFFSLKYQPRRERDDHLGEREWNKLKYSDLQHKGSFGFVQNAEKIVQVACLFFFSRRHPMRKIKPPYILPARTRTWSSSLFYSLYIKLCVILRWSDWHPLPYPPSLLSILKDFPKPRAKRRALLSFYACPIFLSTARTRAWNHHMSW